MESAKKSAMMYFVCSNNEIAPVENMKKVNLFMGHRRT